MTLNVGSRRREAHKMFAVLCGMSVQHSVGASVHVHVHLHRFSRLHATGRDEPNELVNSSF